MRDFFFKFFLLVILPCSIPFADLAIAYSRWRNFTACPTGTSPSALTFGYSELRPGSAPSCLSSGNFAGLDREKLELGFESTPAMLLYWNGHIEENSVLAGKRVLIGQAYPASVYAWDIDAKKVLWRHDFSGPTHADRSHMPINSSAPVIDRAHGRIYGSYIGETYVGKKATDSRLTQHYFSIGLDGSGGEQITVDLSKYLLENGAAATPADISKFIRCRTALGLNTSASPPYLFSGCSVARAFSYQGSQFVHQASSQNVKGIRGILLSLPLDPATGRFGKPDAIRHFIPAGLGSDPEAGVDAGIWHSGGAPALLPGNKLLVATGNGIFRPDLEVFGCAVVRLDGSSLRLDGENALYFSAKGEDPDKAGRLCHASNQDPSSSSPATIEKAGRYFSLIGGKDGYLKAFDPLRLPGTSARPASEAKIIDGYLFGQPVVFPAKRSAALVSIGGNGSDGLSWVGYKLTENYELRRRWENKSAHPRAYNSSAAGTYTGSGDSPLLLIPLIAGGPERPFHASLQIVDAENGRILDELYFEGNSHFSMPTVVDDLVFLPTAEHGLQQFSSRKRFSDFLRHHAWIGRPISKLLWF